MVIVVWFGVVLFRRGNIDFSLGGFKRFMFLGCLLVCFCMYSGFWERVYFFFRDLEGI